MRWWSVLWLLCVVSFSGLAQPTLPDIAVKNEKGSIVLSWNCQYDKLKSIRIRRSADIASGFSVIGELFNQQKGVQSFTDTVPLHGDSYYKLQITFSSGLTWSTNCVQVNVEGKPDVKGAQVDTNMRSAELKRVSISDPAPGKLNDNAFKPDTRQKPTQSVKPIAPPALISYRDTTAAAVTATTFAPIPKPKVRLRYTDAKDTINGPDLFMESKYVTIDPATGFVLIILPDNASLHHYSLRIFDDRNKMIWQIPMLRQPRTLMDTCNFQKKGVYSFILKKDQFEVDRGNFVIR